MSTLSEALSIKIMADATHYHRALRNVVVGSAESVQKIGRNFQSLGKEFMKVGGLLTASIGGAVAISVKEYAAAEREFAAITGLFKESKSELHAYKEAIDEIAWAMGTDTVQTTKGFYQAISAGFRSVEDARGVMEAATKASIAGSTDMDVAVQAITRTLNAFGRSGEDANKVFDLLFQTVNYGVTEFKLLAPVIGRVAGTASAAKISMEEMFAAIAVVTKALPTEEAIVAVNQLLLSFIKPTDAAKEAAAAMGVQLNATELASKGLANIMDQIITKLGVTENQMKRLETATEGADYTQALAEVFGNASEQLAALFPNVRALRGALALATGGGKEFQSTLEAMKDSAGAGEKAFRDQESTLSRMAEKLKSRFRILREEIGKVFAVDIGKAIKKIDELMPKIREWINENPRLIRSIAMIGGAIGVVLTAMGIFNFTLGSFIITISKMVRQLVKMIFFLLNPVTLAIMALAAAAAFLFAVFAPETVGKIWGRFKELLVGGIEKTREFVGSMREMDSAGEDNLDSLEKQLDAYKDHQGGLEQLSKSMEEIAPKDDLFEGILGNVDEWLERLQTTLLEKDPFGNWLDELAAQNIAQRLWRIVFGFDASTSAYILSNLKRTVNFAMEELGRIVKAKLDYLKQIILNFFTFGFLGPTWESSEIPPWVPPGPPEFFNKQGGGWIEGAYNSPQVGIAHAGEYVVNPESSAMFAPLLEAINRMGRNGGVYHDTSTNVWNMGDRFSRELVRDKIIPELGRAKRAGYGLMGGAW